MAYVCKVHPFHSSFSAANSKAARLDRYCCLAKEEAEYKLSDLQLEGTAEWKEGKLSPNIWDTAKVHMAKKN